MKRKLIIAFDARAVARSNKSGIGYYTYGAIQALSDFYPEELELVGHYYNFLGRKSVPKDMPHGQNIRYKTSYLLPEKLVNLLRRFSIEFPFELLTKTRADVHFFPDYLTHHSLFRTPCVCTIHDLTYLDMPETVSARNRQDLRRFVPKSIRRSHTLATISAVAADRIREVYKTKKDIRITYTPPSLPSVSAQAAQDIVRELNISNNYLLFVGTIEPRKNIVNLIKAFELLPETFRKKYQLVLAGGSGWNNEAILEAINKARSEGLEIITPGYVSDEQKAALYQSATAFVFPSYYEGYGIPPLEAMACNTPVVVSDIPVLREVCGDAAEYCKPEAKSIAQSLQIILEDKKRAHELTEKGKTQVKKYSWESVARTLYTAFTKT